MLLVVAALACGEDVPLNGSETVIIEAHVEPDADCRLGPDSPVLTRGTFDILKAGVKDPDPRIKDKDKLPANYCSNPYELNLRVNNRSGESVVFSQAKVAIETFDGLAIDFDRVGAELPNPFATTTLAPVSKGETGVVTVRAIPAEYAAQLEGFRNDEIAVSVILIGTSSSGGSVTSRPFEFPIQLCMGCSYYCLENLLGGDPQVAPETIYGNACADDSGADDRVCIDPNC